MTNNERAVKMLAVAQAEDTEDLLNHIAWTDVVKPKLEAVKQRYAGMLANSVLKVPGSESVPAEVLAARVYGIDFITHTFEEILRKGTRALEELQ